MNRRVLMFAAAGFAWPGLTVSYTVEILPFKIRAKGLTLCFVGTSLAGIFNQYVNPVGLEALAWKFYIVYIVVLVLECLAIYFLYVETRGPVSTIDSVDQSSLLILYLRLSKRSLCYSMDPMLMSLVPLYPWNKSDRWRHTPTERKFKQDAGLYRVLKNRCSNNKSNACYASRVAYLLN